MSIFRKKKNTDEKNMTDLLILECIEKGELLNSYSDIPQFLLYGVRVTIWVSNYAEFCSINSIDGDNDPLKLGERQYAKKEIRQKLINYLYQKKSVYGLLSKYESYRPNKDKYLLNVSFLEENRFKKLDEKIHLLGQSIGKKWEPETQEVITTEEGWKDVKKPTTTKKSKKDKK